MSDAAKPPGPALVPGANAPDHDSGAGEAALAPARIGHWEWDFASGAMTWSDGFYRLLGRAAGSVRASYAQYIGHVHPEDRAATETAARAARAHATGLDTLHRVNRADGAVGWISLHGEVMRDAAGKPGWASGVAFDVTDIRQAQHDLAVREERCRALAALYGVGPWRAGPDGEFVEADFWCAFTGQTMEEMRALGWLQAVHPEDAEPLEALWLEALRIGSQTEASYRLRHRSGAYRWVRSRAAPLRGAGSRIREWLGTIEDIHLRREAEESLRTDLQLRRFALEACRMVTWDYDVHRGHVTWSENAAEVLGIGASTQDLEGWIHPEDRPRVLAARRRCLECGERYDVEYRSLDAHGGIKWVHSRGRQIRNAHKEAERFIGVTIDVTDRKQAELEHERTRQQLRMLEGRYEALAGLVEGIVWVRTPEGQMRDLPAWREFTGQTAEEMRDWGWLNAVHPADRERKRQALQNMMDTAASMPIEYRVRNRIGEYRWFRSRAAPVGGPGSEVREWVGICEPLADAETRSGDTPAEPGAEADDASAIAGWQIRAARAILNWSVRDLAEASSLSSAIIRRFEEDDGAVQTRDSGKLRSLRAALERGGARFLRTTDGSGAVRRARDA